jgi:hypothetical protein
MAKNESTENPQTPPPVNPWDVIDRLTTALERLAQSPASERSPELESRLASALERVADAQMDGSRLIAKEQRELNKRMGRPSNGVVPKISVFNRRGENLPDDVKAPYTTGFKPPLKCNMLIPFIAEWDSLTREEVELLNLLQPGEYILTLVDRSKVRMGVKVDLKLDGKTPSRLLMQNIDNDGNTGTLFKDRSTSKLVPPLSDWLRQLLKQHDPETRKRAAAVLTDEEEEAMIEASALAVSVGSQPTVGAPV